MHKVYFEQFPRFAETRLLEEQLRNKVCYGNGFGCLCRHSVTKLFICTDLQVNVFLSDVQWKWLKVVLVHRVVWLNFAVIVL